MSTTSRAVLLALLPAAAGSGARAGDVEIAEAIRREREPLVIALERQLVSPPDDYPMGRIALSAAAVLEAGTPPAHAAVTSALQALAAMPVSETYSAACHLLAIDANWQALLAERMALAARGKRARSTAPSRPEPLRARMEELVGFLLQGSGGVWGYHLRQDGDLSNTQFAMIGLEIAIENGVTVPVDVLTEVTDALLESRSRPSSSARLEIGYLSPAWPGLIPATRRSVKRTVTPAGWSYRLQPHMEPTAAMTAAGVSSLLIARKGLRRAFALPHDLEMRIDRAIWDGLAWMSRNLGEFREPYALYSLEKVCDLAGIELLDGKDWHALGSRHLIAQRARGEAEWDTADTSLALLFLSRATRSKLHALGPPVFVTPRGGEPVPEHREDLVHVHAAGGFLPAWVIFEFAALSRDPRLGPVIDEALKATPPGRAHEALARVLWLWSEDADAMTALARRAAASIAGAELEDRGAASELVALLAEIHEIEKSDEPGADRLRPLLAAGGSPTLLRRALDLVEREGMIDVLGLVADLVAHEEPAVRRRAHEVLARWTGEPFAAPPGAGGNRAELERAALAWKDWWKRSGAAFLTRRRASRLIARVESSPTPEEREASVEEVVALGAGAVPAILEAMDRGEFSIHLVRALERITGESRGLRAVDWKR